MDTNIAFVGGILFVVLVVFIGYKVKQSRDKKKSTGPAGGTRSGTRMK